MEHEHCSVQGVETGCNGRCAPICQIPSTNAPHQEKKESSRSDSHYRRDETERINRHAKCTESQRLGKDVNRRKMSIELIEAEGAIAKTRRDQTLAAAQRDSWFINDDFVADYRSYGNLAVAIKH